MTCSEIPFGLVPQNASKLLETQNFFVLAYLPTKILAHYISVPECIPVMKRPMMIISGIPMCRLKPMSPPATNTRIVLFTSVPLLHKNTERNNKIHVYNLHRKHYSIVQISSGTLMWVKYNFIHHTYECQIYRILWPHCGLVHYLPNLVTSIPTVREPTSPPMAKMDTVMEYSTVMLSLLRPLP